jgi:hypothetical protein
MYNSAAGVWQSDLRDRSAGLYGVVAGISRYPYLKNGEHCTSDPHDFGQLISSAHTAYRFFSWLTEKYRFEGCPVSKVWLLLGPCQAERPYIPISTPEPTMENLGKAITAWRDDLVAMSTEVANKSRALLFFSGHGLERDLDQQLLLPSDFWSNQVINKAINSKNLQEGLAASRVPWQVFFIDACRNDPFLLDAFSNVRGMDVLTTAPGRRFHRTAPIIYGSASGKSAWQLDDPSKISVFGDALLAGLEVSGIPPIEPDCSSQPCVIDLGPLYSYVNSRVSEALTHLRISEADPDPVATGGVTRGKTPICHVPEPHPDTLSPDTPLVQVSKALAAGAAGLDAWVRSDAVKGVLRARGISESAFFDAPHAVRDLSEMRRVGGVAALAPTEQRTRLKYIRLFDGHGRVQRNTFDSPAVADFFMSAELYRWNVAAWHRSRVKAKILRIERSPDRNIYRVSFEFRDATLWHWMECSSSEQRFAFFFPGLRIEADSTEDRQIFEIELGVDSETEVIRFARPYPSLSNKGLIGEAALLWNKYRLGTAASAVHALTQYAVSKEPIGPASEEPVSQEYAKFALSLLYTKSLSPLAATIGALILTRAGEYDAMRNWLDNLVNLRYGSDAAVFAIKRALDTEQRVDLKRYFDTIAQQGMPFTSEATSYLMQMLDPLQPDEAVADYDKRALNGLRKRLGDLYPGFRTGGLFTSFAARGFELDKDYGLSRVRELYG